MTDLQIASIEVLNTVEIGGITYNPGTYTPVIGVPNSGEISVDEFSLQDLVAQKSNLDLTLIDSSVYEGATTPEATFKVAVAATCVFIMNISNPGYAILCILNTTLL